jgi:hypothetical protein
MQRCTLLKCHGGITVAVVISLGAYGGWTVAVTARVFRQGVHRRLCNAYMRLIDRITAQSFEETTQEQIEGYKREFAAIDAQEPPQLKTLVILCEYEACVARGQPDHVKRPPWWKRLVADFV